MQTPHREAQFIQAKAKADALWEANEKCSKELNEFLGQFPRGPMGLTPEHVKAMPRYIELKRAYAISHARLGEYNREYSKTFAKELRAMRQQRYLATKGSSSKLESVFA